MDERKFIDTRTVHVTVNRRNLPHWHAENACYFVTFRTKDSLPTARIIELQREKQRILTISDPDELSRQKLALLSKLNKWLDLGHGECILRNDSVAAILKDEILDLSGEQVQIPAWCIMPNHVHLIVSPAQHGGLSKVLQILKGRSARLINQHLRRSGSLWQQESFDHLIRNQEKYDKFMSYILLNPVRAGLENWKWTSESFSKSANTD